MMISIIIAIVLISIINTSSHRLLQQEDNACDQNSFIVVADGIDRTWIEARKCCFFEYGTDLAAIKDVNDADFQCAMRNQPCGTSFWTGIYSPNRNTHVRAYCYRATSGECAHEHTCACVGRNSWLNGEPLPCTQGSQCVRYLPCDNKVQNDMFCDQKMTGIICNAQLSPEELAVTSICMETCEYGTAFETCDEGVAVCRCDDNSAPETSCKAWKEDFEEYADQKAEKRKEIRDCIKKAVAATVKKAHDNGEKTDCADTAIKALILAAKECKAPLRLKYWDSKKEPKAGWEYVSYKNYDKVDDFIKDALAKLLSISLLDNSNTQAWDDIAPGDMFVYDLRAHGKTTYKGHTMVVIKGADNDGKYTVIEGHTGGAKMDEETYTKEQLLKKFTRPDGTTLLGRETKGKSDGKGRYWNWKDIISSK